MIDRECSRILLVEDNELDARAMSKALTSDGGCEVERVAELAAAVEALTFRAYDCVLLDLSLPDSDGLQSVETMIARSPHCPVVVLTGLDDPEIAVEAVAIGAQDYLVKGTITADLVARAIRYAVARHSTETELLSAQTRLDNMHAREQIARDLHDTVIQRLFATGMTLQAAAALPDRDEIADRAVNAVGQIDEAIRELREAIFGLHSYDPGESLTVQVAAIASGYADSLGFEPVVRFGDLSDVPTSIHQDVVAVITEALSNVSRHAGASRATVTLKADEDAFVLRVIDNGMQTSAETKVGDRLSGNGLRNMRERAEAHLGSMHFTSVERTGSELTWSVPL
jgi:signal transduction histidine kinase